MLWKREHRRRGDRGQEWENSREEKGGRRRKGGRGLDSSCTVNNTPLGRDRLAHPYYPVTIYLLFVPHVRFVATVAIGRECLPSWKRENLLVQTLSPLCILLISPTSTKSLNWSPLVRQKGATRRHLSEPQAPNLIIPGNRQIFILLVQCCFYYL